MSKSPKRRDPPHSAFGSWFKKQFGHAPNQRRRDFARIKVVELEIALSKAQVDLNWEDALQSRWSNALYGWNARKP